MISLFTLILFSVVSNRLLWFSVCLIKITFAARKVFCNVFKYLWNHKQNISDYFSFTFEINNILLSFSKSVWIRNQNHSVFYFIYFWNQYRMFFWPNTLNYSMYILCLLYYDYFSVYIWIQWILLFYFWLYSEISVIFRKRNQNVLIKLLLFLEKEIRMFWLNYFCFWKKLFLQKTFSPRKKFFGTKNFFQQQKYFVEKTFSPRIIFLQ